RHRAEAVGALPPRRDQEPQPPQPVHQLRVDPGPRGQLRPGEGGLLHRHPLAPAPALLGSLCSAPWRTTERSKPAVEGDVGDSERLDVRKTYKLYIGGKFPRTESGRSYLVADAKGTPWANACRASRKDGRAPAQAARK